MGFAENFFTDWLELGNLELKTRGILDFEYRVTEQRSHTNVSGFTMQFRVIFTNITARQEPRLSVCHSEC